MMKNRNFGTGNVGVGALVRGAEQFRDGPAWGVGRAFGWSAAISGMLLGVAAQSALAGPEGAQVVRGNVRINRNGNETVIHASNRSIINYRNFDIAAHETVRFVQPDSRSRVLNRIDSAAPTRIEGSLLANGRVYIVNPAGVIFTGTSRIDVAGLFAGAGYLTDKDFLRGRDHLRTATGEVVNDGTIRAGDVTLLGRSVTNNGTIVSPQGTVVMAAGEDIMVGRSGSNIYVKVEGAAAGSDTKAAVENNGTIDTSSGRGGGRVALSSGDVFGMALASRNKGTIKARQTTVEGQGTGVVANSGVIDARDQVKQGGSTRGGEVRVLGEYVELSDGSSIDASGAKGGGTVIAGGNFAGSGPERNAIATYVGEGAVVKADATQRGDGGEVSVWADHTTVYRGQISAKGVGGGDGGFVETSGKDTLHALGGVDASATGGGRGGMWLLDPRDVNITNGANANVDDNTAAGVRTISPNNSGGGGASVVQASSIVTSLQGGTSVTIDTIEPLRADAGNITVSNTIAPAMNTGTATLTLRAANNITVSAPITASGANGLNIVFEANSTNLGGDDANVNAGNVVINDPITTNNGNFTSSGIDFTLAANGGNSGNINAGTGVVSVNHRGNVLVNDTEGGFSIRGSAITLHAGNFTSGTGNVTFNNSAELQADSITLRAGDLAAGGGGGTVDASTNTPLFRNSADSAAPSIFTIEQDGNITDAVAPARFGGTLPLGLVYRSFDGTTTIATAANVAASNLVLRGTTVTLPGLTAGNALSSLDVTGAATLNGDIAAGGNIIFNNSVALGAADRAISGAAVSLLGGGSSTGGGLTVTHTGLLTMQGTMALTGTGAFTETGGGNLNLNGSISTVNQAITLNAPTTTVGANGQSLSAGTATITINDDLAIGANTFTLRADQIDFAVASAVTGSAGSVLVLAPATQANGIGVAMATPTTELDISATEIGQINLSGGTVQFGEGGTTQIVVEQFSNTTTRFAFNSGTSSTLLNSDNITGVVGHSLIFNGPTLVSGTTFVRGDNATGAGVDFNGALTLDPGVAFTITANAIGLNGVTGDPTSALTLRPLLTSSTIDIGTAANATLELNPTDLNGIDLEDSGTSGLVTIGHSGGTHVITVGSLNMTGARLSLEAAGAGGFVELANSAVVGARAITFNGEVRVGGTGGSANVQALVAASGIGAEGIIAFEQGAALADDTLTVNANAVNIGTGETVDGSTGSVFAVGAFNATSGVGAADGSATSTSNLSLEQTLFFDRIGLGLGLLRIGRGDSTGTLTVGQTATSLSLGRSATFESGPGGTVLIAGITGTGATSDFTFITGTGGLTQLGDDFAGSTFTTGGGDWDVQGRAGVFADVTITTGGGAMTFDSIEDFGGGINDTLRLNAGAGNITIDGIVGGAAGALRLNTLEIINANNVTFNDDVFARNLDQLAGTGTTSTAVGAILDVDTGGIDLNGNIFDIRGGVSTVSGTTTITNSGTLTIRDTAWTLGTDAASDGAMLVDGTGGVSLRTGITTTNDNVTFAAANNAVAIDGVSTISASTGTVAFVGTRGVNLLNNLTITASEVDFGNAGTVTGNNSSVLTLQPDAVGGLIDVGSTTDVLASLSITDADLSALADGYGSLVIGRTDGTGAYTVETSSFLDPVTFRRETGTTTLTGQISGAGTLGSAANITFTDTTGSNAAVVINASSGISTTGTVLFQNVTATVSELVSAGAVTFSGGSSTLNASISGGAVTFANNTASAGNGVIINAGGGLVNFTGTTTLTLANGATVTIQADEFDIAGTSSISSALGASTLIVQPLTTALDVQVGGTTAAAGRLDILNAELSQFLSSGTNLLSVTFGRSNSSGDIIIAAGSVAFPATFRTQTGEINIGANLSGTGVASLTFSGPTRITAAGVQITTQNRNITFNNSLSVEAAGLLVDSGDAVVAFNDTVALGTFGMTVEAEDVDFAGANSVTGTNALLTLRPNNAAANIFLGDGTGAGAGDFVLLQSDFSAFTNDFGRLVVGQAAGTHLVTIENLTIRDGLRVITNGAGRIDVIGTMNGTGGQADADFVAQLGGGATLRLGLGSAVNMLGGDFIVLGPTDLAGDSSVVSNGGRIYFGGRVDALANDGASLTADAGSAGVLVFGELDPGATDDDNDGDNLDLATDAYVADATRTTVGGNFRLLNLTISDGATIRANAVNVGDRLLQSAGGHARYEGLLSSGLSAGGVNDIDLTGQRFTITGGAQTQGEGAFLLTNTSTTDASVISGVGLGLDGQFRKLGQGTLDLSVNILTADADITFGGAGVNDTGGVRIGAAANGLTVTLNTQDAGGPVDTVTFARGVTIQDNTLRVLANAIDFTGGAASVTGGGAGNLVLRGPAAATTIGVGGGAGTLQISDTDIAALGAGFTLAIGETGQTGRIVLGDGTAGDNNVFAGPLTLTSDGVGGAVDIAGRVRLSTAGAAFTINGSGATTTLLADIVTTGGDIIIDDLVILDTIATSQFLDAVLLDTTDGGNAAGGATIRITGDITVATTGIDTPDGIVMDAGSAGTVDLQGVVGGTGTQRLDVFRIRNSGDFTLATNVFARTIELFNELNNASIAGAVTINSTLDATTGVVDISGSVINFNGDILTSGSNTPGESAVRFRSPVLLGGAGTRTITTNGSVAAGGNVTFDAGATLNGARNLTITAGGGAVDFGAAIGNTTSLLNLVIASSTGGTTFSGGASAAGIDIQNGGAVLIENALVQTTGAFSSVGATFTNNAAVSAGGAVSVVHSGAVTINANVTSTSAGAGADVLLHAGNSATAADLTFGAGVTVRGDDIDLRAGNGVGGDSTASVNAATNAPVFANGAGDNNPTSFAIRMDGSITDTVVAPLNSQFTALAGGDCMPYTLQSLEGGVTVNDGARFNGTSLTLDAATIVTLNSSLNVCALAVNVGAGGCFEIGADIITTASGGQTYNTDVCIIGDVTLNAGTATIAFNQQVFVGGNALGLIADEINILGNVNPGTISLPTTPGGSVSFAAFTGTRTVGIGTAENAGRLDLTSAELAFLQNGFNLLTFGRADSAGDVTVASAQTFADPITLITGTGGFINVNAALRMNDTQVTGGALTLNGPVVNLGGPVRTAGSAIVITAADRVELQSNALLDSTRIDDGDALTAGADVTVNSVVSADDEGNLRTFTVRAGTAGSIFLNGDVGGAGVSPQSVSLSGGPIISVVNVTTLGAQEYTANLLRLPGNLTSTTSGDITVNGSVDLVAGAGSTSSIETAGNPGDDVVVTGDISSTANRSLVITTNSGDITIAGGLGTAAGTDPATRLTNATLIGTNNTVGTIGNTGPGVRLLGNLLLQGTSVVHGTTDASGGVLGIGVATYNGSVAAGGNVNMDGSVTFNGAVTSVNGLIGVSGNAIFNGDASAFGALGVIGTTTVGGNPAGNPVTLAGSTVNLNGAVTLEDNTTIGRSTGAATSVVTFGSTVDSAAAENNTLTIISPTTIFSGNVGSGVALGALTVGGAATLSGSAITTTGAQEYDGPVTLANNVAITTSLPGGDVTFADVITVSGGARSLTVATDAAATRVFGGSVGTSTDRLTSLTVTGAGTNRFGGDVFTTGVQGYAGNTLLSSATHLFDGSGITFGGTLNGLSVAPAVTINGGAAGVSVAGNIGGTQALSSLTATGSTIAVQGVTTSGAQAYNGATSINGVLQTTNAAVDVNGTLALGGASAINTAGGNIGIDGAIGGGGNALTLNAAGGNITLEDLAANLASLQATGAIITLRSVSTAADQLYTGITRLGANSVFTSTGGGVEFAGTVDSAGATPFSLSVNAPGVTRFAAAVGGTNALASVATGAGGTTELNGQVTATGDVLLTDNTLLGSDTTINGNDIEFGGTVNSLGSARSLLLNSTSVGADAGRTVFAGTVGNSLALRNLTTNGDAGGIVVIANNITTTGDIDFGDAAEIGGDAIVDAGAGNIRFRRTIDALDGLGSEPSLTLRTTASASAFSGNDGIPQIPIRLGGNVGATRRLGAFTIGGGRSAVSPTATVVLTDAFDDQGRIVAANVGDPVNSNASGAQTAFDQLSIRVGAGGFTMGQNEKLLALGQLSINSAGDATIGDISALSSISVTAGGDVNIRLRTGAPVNEFTGLGGSRTLGSVNDFGVDLVADQSITLTPGAGRQVRLITTDNGFNAPGAATESGGNITPTGSTDPNRGFLIRPFENGVSIDAFRVGQNSGQPNGQFLQPLDLRNEGSGVNPATTIAGAIPRDTTEREVTAPVTVGADVRKLLREEISLITEPADFETVVQSLVGRALYDDVPEVANPSASDLRITVNRISEPPAQAVVAAYRALMYTDEAGNPVTIKQDTRLKTILDNAYTLYTVEAEAAGQEPDGLGFRAWLDAAAAAPDAEVAATRSRLEAEFASRERGENEPEGYSFEQWLVQRLIEDVEDTETPEYKAESRVLASLLAPKSLDILNKTDAVIKSLSNLGLTPREIQGPVKVLITSVKPGGMKDESEFLAAITGSRVSLNRK